MQLSGKVALVTGAGRRVGRALALALADRGAAVAVHYHGSADGARATVADVERRGARAAAFQADLGDAHAPGALVASVAKTLGGLDILVNSAAVMARTPFGEVSADAWDRIFALNLRAPFLLAQAAAPRLRESHGAIVNIADLSAFETWPGYVPHGLTKSGVVYLTRALAQMLAPAVRVNAVAPGTVLLPDEWSAADAERMRRTTPLERDGTPDDVVAAMLFLLDSDFITGETIVVDGGRHVRR